MSDELEEDFIAIERGETPRSPEATKQHQALVSALKAGVRGDSGGVDDDDGWMQGVLDAVEEPEADTAPANQSRYDRRWVAAAILVAAAVLLFVLLRPSPGPPGSGAEVPNFSLTRLDGGPVVRSRDIAPGDTVRLVWPSEGGLWVYFNDNTLVLRCPGADACAVDGNRGQADLLLPKAGGYTFVRVDGTAPAPNGALDDDLARALEQGHVASIEADLDVR